MRTAMHRHLTFRVTEPRPRFGRRLSPPHPAAFVNIIRASAMIRAEEVRAEMRAVSETDERARDDCDSHVTMHHVEPRNDYIDLKSISVPLRLSKLQVYAFKRIALTGGRIETEISQFKIAVQDCFGLNSR